MKKKLQLKNIICVSMALCLAVLTIGNTAVARGADNTDDKFLSGIEIPATVGSNYEDQDKIDDPFYKNIELNYDSGYKSEKNALIIENEKQLAAFAKAVNEGKDFDKKYVKLGNDINLNGTAPQISKVDEQGDKYKIVVEGRLNNVWVPIGKDDRHAFKGTFDGNHKVIRNMVVLNNKSSDHVYSGLFGRVEGNGTIQNLGMEGGGECGIFFFCFF